MALKRIYLNKKKEGFEEKKKRCFDIREREIFRYFIFVLHRQINRRLVLRVGERNTKQTCRLIRSVRNEFLTSCLF